jgi:hypothetical protein
LWPHCTYQLRCDYNLDKYWFLPPRQSLIFDRETFHLAKSPTRISDFWVEVDEYYYNYLRHIPIRATSLRLPKVGDHVKAISSDDKWYDCESEKYPNELMDRGYRWVENKPKWSVKVVDKRNIHVWEISVICGLECNGAPMYRIHISYNQGNPYTYICDYVWDKHIQTAYELCGKLNNGEQIKF